MRAFYDGRDDDNDSEYEAPLFHFEDDEDQSEYEPLPIHFDDEPSEPARVEATVSHQFDYVDDAPPVRSPAAVPPASSTRDEQPVSFGGDQPTSPRSSEAASGTFVSRYNDQQSDEDSAPTHVPLFDDDDQPSDDDSDSDSIAFTFGRVDGQSAPREKEFVFMPFLDIPDEPEESDEDRVQLTFSKVKAERREKEFIFMPFLNPQEDEEAEEEVSPHGRFRSSKGTIIDEGLVLIPLEEDSEQEDDEAAEDHHESDHDILEDDSGISIVSEDAAPSAIRRAPSPEKKRPSGGKGGSPKGSGKGSAPKGGSGKSSKLDPEQQFRQAMRNIDPAILAAVRHDPIQRAALEQAVRIALVQQAAQEAVEKTTGRPMFGYSAAPQQRGEPSSKKKKKKPADAAQRPSTPYESVSRSKQRGASRASAVNVQASGISIFDTAPSEFGVSAEPSPAQPASFEPTGSTAPKASPTNFTPSPSAQQDPALAALDARNGANAVGMPDSSQDPALAALSKSGAPLSDNPPPREGGMSAAIPSERRGYAATPSSPAAIRAAMRSGACHRSGATTATVTSAVNAASSAAPRRESESEVAKRSGCLVWIIVAFIAFFIGLLAIAVWPALSKELSYQAAVESLNSGISDPASYLTAADSFDALADYKDSSTRSDEAYYLYASTLLAQGDYLRALTYFNSVSPTYSDVTERVAECRYNLGKEYLEAKNYASAYDQFYLIPKYLDAGELAINSNYMAAEQLYAAENYEDARVRYSMFPDYLDSRAKWESAQSLCAQKSYNDGKYAEAYTLFKELGTFNYAPYYAALSLTQAVLNDSEYTGEEMQAALNTLLAYPADNNAQTALDSHVFDKYMLVGSWTSDDGTLDFDLSDNTNTFVAALDGSARVELADVFFDNTGAVCPDSRSTDSPVMQIVSFVTDTGATPPAVTVRMSDSNREYTLDRT